MKSNDYFGTTIDCPCGKRHVIAPDELIYSDDAVEQLPVAGRRAVGDKPLRACVLMDIRTQPVAADAVAAALEADGWEARRVVIPDPAPGRGVVCDATARDYILGRSEGTELFVPVGSGVLSDLAKWTARTHPARIVTFATAASMNGYSSANIAPTIGGVKSLVYGDPVDAVLASPRILAEAPYEMTAAGLGDVLAKSVSSADWYLNHLLFGDYYCPRAVELIAEIEPLYLDNPQGVRDRKPQVLAGLFDALLLTGVAMTMAGTSAPASGGEHLISHALDMLSGLEDTEHDLHGRQVGVGTILTAELYRRVLAVESPVLPEPKPRVDSAVWGPLTDVVAEKYAEKLPRLHQVRKHLRKGDAWDRLRAQLAGVFPPNPEAIHNCLALAAAATKARDIGCDRDRLVWALLNANEIRSRFTILDLGYLTGVLPSSADQIVRKWS